MRNRGPERVLFLLLLLLFHFLSSYYFFYSGSIVTGFQKCRASLSWVFFLCRFQIFCISLLLISNSSVLWGVFSSGLSLCDDFRKKMSFLLPYMSGHIKARHSQGEDKVPCLYPWYLD